jgi:hypothetical protein
MRKMGSFPVRLFTRHKAKEQLKGDPELSELNESLDETLFQEVADGLLNSERVLALYDQSCSRDRASVIEDRIAAEIMEGYKRIKLRQLDPFVQNLNALLD